MPGDVSNGFGLTQKEPASLLVRPRFVRTRVPFGTAFDQASFSGSTPVLSLRSRTSKLAGSFSSSPRCAGIALAILASGCFALSGCTTVAKRAFNEVRGARTNVTAVPGKDVEDVENYGRIEIAPVRTDLGELVDTVFSEVLPSRLLQSLSETENPPFTGGGEQMILEPEIKYYQRRKTVGAILGSDACVVVLFWIKAGGVEIGRLQAVTRSGAARTDAPDMAADMARALAEYFRKKKPKEEP